MTHSFFDTFSGFHKKTRAKRLELLVEAGLISSEDKCFLEQSVNQGIVDTSEKFIENVIGCLPLPIGLVPNVVIDGSPRMIPMAVEETSIIAALNKTAKWVRQSGRITTSRAGNLIIGQIQISKVKNTVHLTSMLKQHKAQLIKDVNQNILHSLVKRGGGIVDLTLRLIDRRDQGQMAVIHVLCDTCEAMGANFINQACEYLKPKIADLSQETINICIVSNLTDSQLTTATITLPNIGPKLGHDIAEAAHFAGQDPYRAATHNKGIMNGIDPILIATGNDWRAVEAGMHAYATCKTGGYSALSSWTFDQASKTLTGTLTGPICVGTVGGVTTLHPTVKRCVKLLAVKNAEDLSRICAAVGLLQNLAALHALTTQGIVKGHMQLHIDNLVVAAGANVQEEPILRNHLTEMLHFCKKISLSDAQSTLEKLRCNQEHLTSTS